jgi:hypothetical protein
VGYFAGSYFPERYFAERYYPHGAAGAGGYFAPAYFAPAYFEPHYFAPGVVVIVVPPPTPTPSTPSTGGGSLDWAPFRLPFRRYPPPTIYVVEPVIVLAEGMVSARLAQEYGLAARIVSIAFLRADDPLWWQAAAPFAIDLHGVVRLDRLAQRFAGSPTGLVARGKLLESDWWEEIEREDAELLGL